jgi:cellulose synthase operon protein C
MRKQIAVVFFSFILLFTAMAFVAPAAVAQDDQGGAIEQLQQSAEYWKQRGRTDKMVEIWKKILSADPGNTSALVNLATYYAGAGNESQARNYLQRLNSVQPGHPSIAAIERSLAAGPISEDALTQARALSRQGRKQEAVEKYREVFGGGSPAGPIALEYYQTLGGTPGGWEEARSGMERLAAENPGSNGIARALAKHLTYRESTRREGISRLQALGANKAWRQALLWLGASAADAKYYNAYLQAAGEDEAIRARLDKVRSMTSPGYKGPDRLDEGFQALEANDVNRADEAFQWALKQSRRNVDAIVGMALVEMERENFTNARKLLEEAQRLSPRRPEKWERSLQSARFWEQMKSAESAIEQSLFEKAQIDLEQARAISPEDSLHVDLATGNLYREMGYSEKAAETFRGVLEQDPNNVGALVAIVHIMLTLGQREAATIFNTRLAQIAPDKALPIERVESEALRYQASFERQVGELEQARTLLEESVQLDPSNAWARFDLADLYKDLGRFKDSHRILNELLAQEPDEAAFVLAAARLYAAQGLFDKALEAAASIPDSKMNEETRRLRTELEIQLIAQNAVRHARYGGNIGTARHRLSQLQAQVAEDPALLALVGLAWAELGDFDRALTVVRSAMSRTDRNNAGVRLQLASILLKADRNAELREVLAEIRSLPNLTQREMKDLTDIRVAQAVRRADQARERGEYTLAYSHIAPLLRDFPKDPRLLAGVGRLLYSQGEYAESEAVFLKILLDSPDSLEGLQGAVTASMKLGKKSQANRLLRAGFEKRPDDPRVHLIAGRAALMTGKDGKAMRHFKKALSLERSWSATSPEAATYRFQTNSSAESNSDLLFEKVMAKTTGQSGADTLPGSDHATLRYEIQREINNIDSQYRTDIGLGAQVRFRDGESGMSRLTEILTPLSLRIPAGYVGRIEFTAAPVFLDAGSLDLDDPFTAERFGTYGVTPYAGDTAEKTQQEYGAELELGYAYRGYGIYIGSSPIGFPVETVTGRILIGDQINNFGFRFTGERETVEDSLLSYAGIMDPNSDEIWGGVTRNGGRLDLSAGRRPVLWYGYGGYHYLLGENVLDNTVWSGGTGLQWTIYDRNLTTAYTGLTANSFGYQYNQRFFTYGHGGYFSPQLFVNAGVPLVVEGRYRQLGYSVDALAGLNWFTENKTDYYPLDDSDDLQTQREGMVDAQGEPVIFENDEKEGELSFLLNAGGSVAYQITPQLEATFSFHVYTAEEYNEFIGKIGFTYFFGAPPGRAQPSIPPIPE